MILAQLKERTRGLHDRAERSVDLASRLHSRERYRSLLCRFLGFYEPIEERLSTVAGLDLSGRLKARMLWDDLQSLGLTGTEIGLLPRCADLPLVADLAAGFGCLYVLEGATLGGQFVRRAAEARLGIGPGSGCSFFTSYGDRVGPMWKAFGQTLEGYAAAHPAAEGQVIASAAATFAAFERWVVGDAA